MIVPRRVPRWRVVFVTRTTHPQPNFHRNRLANASHRPAPSSNSAVERILREISVCMSYGGQLVRTAGRDFLIQIPHRKMPLRRHSVSAPQAVLMPGHSRRNQPPHRPLLKEESYRTQPGSNGEDPCTHPKDYSKTRLQPAVSITSNPGVSDPTLKTLGKVANIPHQGLTNTELRGGVVLSGPRLRK